MTEALRYVVEFDVVFQHHRGVGVAEGVEAAAAKDFFAPHVEVAHVIAVHGTAVRAGADKVVFGIVFAVETAVLRLLGFMTQQGFV